MARKKCIISTIIKFSNQIEKENHRIRKAQEKEQRQMERSNKIIAREEALERRKKSMELKRAQAEELKQQTRMRRQQDKEHLIYMKRIKSSLTLSTITHYGLGVKKSMKCTTVNDLSILKEISKIRNTKKSSESTFRAKYGLVKFDEIVFSGKFNSVLGYDGLIYFKNQLDGLKISFDGFVLQDNKFIKLLDLVFRSGVYLSVDGEKRESMSWLTAYRFLLKNYDLHINEVYDHTKICDWVRNCTVDVRDKDLCSVGNKEELLTYLLELNMKLVAELESFIQIKNTNRLVG